MYYTALLIGIYSYAIFILGIVHDLYLMPIILVRTIFIALELLVVSKVKLSHEKQPYVFYFLFTVLCTQALINVIGVLGPELSFDALWYHLTLPKLYLLSHSVFYIPGNLLYYSPLPKTTEMLYTAALILTNETMAKGIQFMFGLLICIALYKFCRKYFPSSYSLLTVVIYYANLVVAWESITAYTDLAWGFFTFLSFTSFIKFYKSRRLSALIISAILTGFAVTTKLNGVELLIIYSILLLYIFRSYSYSIIYAIISVIVPLPWFIFSYIYTKNPVYPFFSNLYPISPHQSLFNFINPLHFINAVFMLFTHSADPVSPIYIIAFPLIIFYYQKMEKECKVITWFSILALLLWYIIPQTGGSRFIIPYLPLLSFLVINVIELTKNVFVKKLLVTVIILVAITSIIYRGAANAKYLPYILGKETKAEFLTKHLNFSYGDFYDTDNYFASHIKRSDKVLLYGFHNLYYIDFPFIDSSWIQKKDTFNFVAVQNGTLPKQYKHATLVYQNQITHVKLYKLSKLWKY